MTVFLLSCERLKQPVEAQWEAGDAASLAAASSVSARRRLQRLELSLPIDVPLTTLCWLPAQPACHLWHPRSTQRPQLHAAPKMVSCSTAAELGNARHTQQPGSDWSYLLSQRAFETGTAAISHSGPGRRTERLCHREREREKDKG